MTKRSLISLFIKMAGIFFLVSSIRPLLSLGPIISLTFHRMGGYQYPDRNLFLVAFLFFLIGVVAFILVFIKYSDYFSRKVVLDDQPLFPLTSFSSEDIQSLAFSWIALSLLLSGLSAIIGNITSLISIKTTIGSISNLTSSSLKTTIGSEGINMVDKLIVGSSIADIVSNLAKMSIGVLLFLYPRGISRLWHWLHGKKIPNQNLQQDVPPVLS